MFYVLSQLLTTLQTLPQVRGADVPAGVRAAAGGAARGQALLPAVHQHAAPGAGGPPHEGGKEQLPAAAQGRVERGEDRAQEPAAFNKF